MVGRPSKYKPEYCDAVIEHMATGASLTSFAAEVSVARSVVQAWSHQYPEFGEAVAIAKCKCIAWWEKAGRHLATTGEGNATAVVFGLKNMGLEDWKDRREHQHSGPDGGPIASKLTVEIVGADE